MYNTAGLLSHITHRIGTSTAISLAAHTYNSLNELTGKSFPAASGAAFTYAYNIRGWLKKINDPALSNATTKLFAQELFYETGGTAGNWNGNISRADWRGQDDTKREYNYAYDAANRIKTAMYTVTGNSAQNGRYNLGYINYDRNGNITTLQRVNQQASSGWGMVDNLAYTYAAHSNMLTQVRDYQTATTYLSKDFRERSATAYGYDVNGNLKSNPDKEITGIVYNHLNLPSEITLSGTDRSISYQYDAEGNKVRQVMQDGGTTTTMDYIGEFVFQNNAIDYLVHEEGRVAYESGIARYEFFVKDHLGNIRQVIRSPESAGARIATMEPERAEEEEGYFQNIKESRQGAAEHNVTPGGYGTAWLNADRGRILGPARAQEVQQGDSISLSVFGKYVDPRKVRLLPASLAGTRGLTKLTQQLAELGQQYQSVGPNQLLLLNAIHLIISNLKLRPVPEAYMGYALYDADSTLYESGKVLLSKKSRNKHEELKKKTYISKDGYIEAFVVNETSENVWYDNFRIQSTGPIIVQETHYDPWGVELQGLGYQYSGIKVNKYLYNGKELNDHLGVNLHDYGARLYDAAIGRWFVVDPLADQRSWVSPYNFVQNNPLNRIDPDGALDNPVVNSQGEFLGFDELGAGGEAIVYDGAFKEGMSQDAIFSNGGQFATDFFIGNNFNMGDALDFQSKTNQSYRNKINTEALLATGDLIAAISTGLSFMTGGAGGASVATRSGLMARGIGNQALTASPKLFNATEQTSRSAVKRIAQSMSQSGWQGEAIHAYKLKDGTFAILNGHHRVQAATKVGIDVQYKVLNFTEAQSLYGWKTEAEIIMSIIR